MYHIIANHPIITAQYTIRPYALADTILAVYGTEQQKNRSEEHTSELQFVATQQDILINAIDINNFISLSLFPLCSYIKYTRTTVGIR